MSDEKQDLAWDYFDKMQSAESEDERVALRREMDSAIMSGEMGLEHMLGVVLTLKEVGDDEEE